MQSCALTYVLTASDSTICAHYCSVCRSCKAMLPRMYSLPLSRGLCALSQGWHTVQLHLHYLHMWHLPRPGMHLLSCQKAPTTCMHLCGSKSLKPMHLSKCLTCPSIRNLLSKRHSCRAMLLHMCFPPTVCAHSRTSA